MDEICGDVLVHQIGLTGLLRGQFLRLAERNDSSTGHKGNDRIDGDAANSALLIGKWRRRIWAALAMALSSMEAQPIRHLDMPFMTSCRSQCRRSIECD